MNYAISRSYTAASVTAFSPVGRRQLTLPRYTGGQSRFRRSRLHITGLMTSSRVGHIDLGRGGSHSNLHEWSEVASVVVDPKDPLRLEGDDFDLLEPVDIQIG